MGQPALLCKLKEIYVILKIIQNSELCLKYEMDDVNFNLLGNTPISFCMVNCVLIKFCVML